MSIVVGILVGPFLNKNKLRVCKTGTDEDGSDNNYHLFPVNCSLSPSHWSLSERQEDSDRSSVNCRAHKLFIHQLKSKGNLESPIILLCSILDSWMMWRLNDVSVQQSCRYGENTQGQKSRDRINPRTFLLWLWQQPQLSPSLWCCFSNVPCPWDLGRGTTPGASCPRPWGWRGRSCTSTGSPRYKWGPPRSVPLPDAWWDAPLCPVQNSCCIWLVQSSIHITYRSGPSFTVNLEVIMLFLPWWQCVPSWCLCDQVPGVL